MSRMFPTQVESLAPYSAPTGLGAALEATKYHQGWPLRSTVGVTQVIPSATEPEQQAIHPQALELHHWSDWPRITGRAPRFLSTTQKGPPQRENYRSVLWLKGLKHTVCMQEPQVLSPAPHGSHNTSRSSPEYLSTVAEAVPMDHWLWHETKTNKKYTTIK